jgi:hypothetical protein
MVECKLGKSRTQERVDATVNVKVKQSRYRPGVAKSVSGSKVFQI